MRPLHGPGAATISCRCTRTQPMTRRLEWQRCRSRPPMPVDPALRVRLRLATGRNAERHPPGKRGSPQFLNWCAAARD